MSDVLKEFADSRWLGAADIGDEDIPVTVLGTSRETVKDRSGGDAVKLCVKLRGVEKPVLLNRTNVKALATVLGSDDSRWVGATAVLYAVDTSMGKGLRFRSIKAKVAAAPKPKAAADEPNEAIGF
jgi:hypothetical protein